MRSSLQRLRRFQTRAYDFFMEKELASGAHEKSRTWRLAHFLLLVFKSYDKNRCPLRASALTYTTLLALVPLLAVGVSVTSSFLKNDTARIDSLVSGLIDRVAPQINLLPENAQNEGTPDSTIEPELSAGATPGTVAPAPATGKKKLSRVDQKAVAQQIQGFIRNVDSGKLGVTAVVALIFVAISLLSTIEATFNDIWGVVKGRSWYTRIIHYWAAISLGPIFLVTAVGLTTGKYMDTYAALIKKAPFAGIMVTSLLPFVIFSLAFALFYRQMPNTHVLWKAALIGGAVGGGLWQLNYNFSAIYVSRVITYSKLYGSLGAFPVFLVGLYFSWLIVLLGAQVAYAYQNREAYIQEKRAERINQRGREFVAFRLMTLLARRFQAGEKALTGTEMAKELSIPLQLVSQVICVMVSAGLVSELAGENMPYAPAKPLDQINGWDILNAMRVAQGHDLATRDDAERDLVMAEFGRIEQASVEMGQQRTLADMTQTISREPSVI